jgi:hypothetical protein
MKTSKTNEDPFNENQSLQVIRDMIEVSKNNLKSDGILFIIWGWVLFFSAFTRFLLRTFIVTPQISFYVNLVLIILFIICIIISVRYIYRRRRMVKTYTGEILHYLWGAIIFLNLYILFFQLNSNINIDWLFSQYMLMLALGTFVTGGIIKFKPLIYCSIIIFAFVQISLLFHKEFSILIASLSFIIGLSLPGHILYSKRKKTIANV